MIVIDIFPVLLSSFVTGMIEELSDHLEGISFAKKSVESSDGNQTKQLCNCINIQVKIRAVQAEISSIFGILIFLQCFMSCLILSMTTFSLTVVSLTLKKFNLSNKQSSGHSKIYVFAYCFVHGSHDLANILPCSLGNDMKIAFQKLSTSLFHTNFWRISIHDLAK